MESLLRSTGPSRYEIGGYLLEFRGWGPSVHPEWVVGHWTAEPSDGVAGTSIHTTVMVSKLATEELRAARKRQGFYELLEEVLSYLDVRLERRFGQGSLRLGEDSRGVGAGGAGPASAAGTQ